jgi:primase-polymerase (primpol)-like protein
MDNKIETKKGISKVKLTNVPEELQTHKQWVAWKAVPQGGGKFTKVPVHPKTGANAATNNPSTWGSFEEACEHYVWNKDNGIDGVGFVFTKEDPFCGVDLDDCRDPKTGQFKDWAADILKQLNSYSEISPSNTGVKIFLKGSLPGHGRNFGNVEMYDTGRFFTLTGETFNGYPKTIEDRSAELSDQRAWPVKSMSTLFP